MFAAKLREHAVFSAYAEVVRNNHGPNRCASCILRVRGGSSKPDKPEDLSEEYSPRTRR